MGSRRDIIVLTAVLFALAALALLLRPASDASGDDPRVSSFLTGPGGAAALYQVMDELGIETVRQLEPWSADSSRDALVVLAPSQMPGPAELEALRSWIEDGGTLIYASGGIGYIDEMFGLELMSLRPDALGALATVRWTGETSLPSRHAWTVDVDSVAGFQRAFDPSSVLFGDTAATVLLATRDGHPTLVAFPLGSGRVIAWSDANVLVNRSLRTGDAALLFARAASAIVTDDALPFDEYHHGFRAASPVRALAAVLTGTGGGRALLQGLVACMALLLFFGARFGAPVREHHERRRSPLEHVQALAGAYDRAGARGAARRLLLAGMERRLGRRMLRGTDALPSAALGSTASGRKLRQEWERGEKGDLVELSAAVDDYVTEIRR